ncbi:hypothetical protein LCGC14_1513120 [marine sediment metagenome]|uniref:Uncharacterized protein n=1 Tax=marine sediment metagenome TaxID=412755 RepID=A0A0F9LGC9_9ZZZZ
MTQVTLEQLDNEIKSRALGKNIVSTDDIDAELGERANVDPSFFKKIGQATKEFVRPQFAGLSQRAEVESFIQRELPEPSFEGAGDVRVGSMVGQTIGGIAGAPGGIPGIAGGAFLGGAAGEAFQQIIERMLGLPSPETPLEAAKDIGIQGAIGTASELGGRAAFATGQKILQPFKSKILSASDDAIRFMKNKLKKVRPQLTPAETTESVILDVGENLADNSIIGSGTARKFKFNRQLAFEELGDDFAQGMGQHLPDDQLGDTIVGIINGKLKANRAAATTIYNRVDELTKDLFVTKFGNFISPISRTSTKVGIVSLKETKAFARDVSNSLKNIKLRGDLSGAEITNTILGMPDNVSVAEAQKLRSLLRKIGDEFNIVNKGAPAQGATKRMTATVTKAMMSALKKHSPEAFELQKSADTLFKHGSKKFNNQFLRRLFKMADPDFGNNPEGVVRALMQPRKVSNIRNFKAAVGEEEFKKFRTFLTDDVLKSSVNPIDDTLNGQRMFAKLFGKNGFGDNMLKEIYNPKQLKFLKDFTNALKITQARPPTTTGRMFIQLAQAGAAITVISAPFGEKKQRIAGASVILFGPAVLAKMFSDPTFVKLLTTGVKLPAGSKLLPGVMLRLMAMKLKFEQKIERAGGQLIEGFNKNRQVPVGFTQPQI